MQPDFPRQLIKGKIAELVFDQMFREVGGYTVIPFGYESVVPELMQYARGRVDAGVLENVRNAPDFALVAHQPEHVYLVEVKYRRAMDVDEIVARAASICGRWRLAYLFVATPEGFYFGSCASIVAARALPDRLPFSVVPRHIQDKYRLVLAEFVH